MSALWKRDSHGVGASGGARTTQTYIFGVGASGALLAGAGVALISLVGLVSFDVWPGSPAGVGPSEEVQLDLGGGAAEPADDGSLGGEVGILTSGAPVETAEGPARGRGGDGGAQNPARPERPASPPAGTEAPAPAAPAPAPAPVDGTDRSGGDSGSVKTPSAQDEPTGPGTEASRPPRRTPPGHSKGGRGRGTTDGSTSRGGSNSQGGGSSRGGGASRGGGKSKPPRTSRPPSPPPQSSPGSSGSVSTPGPGSNSGAKG